jgi:hypothetical protein
MTQYIIDDTRYVIFKNLIPEKELIIFKIIKSILFDGNYEISFNKIKKCTIDVINSKFDYYYDNTCLVENYTLLNLCCYNYNHNSYNIIYYLIENGADLLNEYKRKEDCNKSNCLNDLEFLKKCYGNMMESNYYITRINELELLINKIKQNIEVPNKLCRII